MHHCAYTVQTALIVSLPSLLRRIAVSKASWSSPADAFRLRSGVDPCCMHNYAHDLLLRHCPLQHSDATHEPETRPDGWQFAGRHTHVCRRLLRCQQFPLQQSLSLLQRSSSCCAAQPVGADVGGVVGESVGEVVVGECVGAVVVGESVGACVVGELVGAGGVGGPEGHGPWHARTSA
jgi:hypothetical protein